MSLNIYNPLACCLQIAALILIIYTIVAIRNLSKLLFSLRNTISNHKEEIDNLLSTTPVVMENLLFLSEEAIDISNKIAEAKEEYLVKDTFITSILKFIYTTFFKKEDKTQNPI